MVPGRLGNHGLSARRHAVEGIRLELETVAIQNPSMEERIVRERLRRRGGVICTRVQVSYFFMFAKVLKALLKLYKGYI